MGWPLSQENIFAFDAWEEAEHSTNWGPTDLDAYNVLDTTLIVGTNTPAGMSVCPGESSYVPGCGVQAYPDASTGLIATVQTLQENQYICPLNVVFSAADPNPGATLSALLSEPPFINGWTPADSGFVASEYTTEIDTDEAWSGY